MEKNKPKPQRDTNLSPMLYGKVPPQAIELEETVLGAIMLEPDKLDDVMEIIHSSEIFYSEHHKKIYEAILAVYRSGGKVDLHMVTNHLRNMGELELIGGAYYLTTLTMTVVSSAHVTNHARIIVEKYINRENIRIGGELVSDAYSDEDCFAVSDKAVINLNNIYDMQGDTVSHVSESMRKTTETMLAARENPNTLQGINTGLQALNELTNGWKDGNLIILAARPSEGKSALALNFVLDAAKSNCPVLFFSMEMSKEELTQRMAANVSGVNMENIQKGTITDIELDMVNRAANEVSKLPIYLDDRGGLNYLQIRNKTRKLKKSKGIKMVVIDYLQLASCPEMKGKNREQQVSEISRNFKLIAKDFGIPVIALSQLNRATDQKRPTNANLRESGALEQDADLILFIYHGEVNGVMANNLLLTKNRNGKTGEIEVKFYGAIQKWADKEEGNYNHFASFQTMREEKPKWKDDQPFG